MAFEETKKAEEIADAEESRPLATALPPARFPNAFIVTYGRSGSTLLQGVINSIPGYLMRGENRNILGALQTAYRHFPHYGDALGARTQSVRKATEPNDSWYGYEHFRDEIYYQALRKFLDHLLLQGVDRGVVRCYGFKEIRYDIDNIGAKLDFLRKLYPGTAFLLNTRNPEDVVRSEFQKGASVEKIRRFNEKIASLAQQDDCCLVRYEDVLALSGTLVGLFDFLGEAFDKQHLQDVLKVKHGYHTPQPGSAYSDHPFFADVNKTLSGVEFFLLDGISRDGPIVRLGGILVADPAGPPPPRFARVVDPADGTDCTVEISQNGSSPFIARKLDKPHAAKARFHIVCQPAGASAEVRLADGQVAIRLRNLDQLDGVPRKAGQASG